MNDKVYLDQSLWIKHKEFYEFAARYCPKRTTCLSSKNTDRDTLIFYDIHHNITAKNHE